MKKIPRIGVTRGKTLPRRPELYVNALERAGGSAEYVCTGTPLSVAERFDGLLIPGGRDISPLLYHEEHRYVINPEDEERTRHEMRLLGDALKQGKPVLGICYGMQLLNVFFEGSLYQDIASEMGGAENHGEGTHSVEIMVNPFIKTGRYDVNGGHHQAVKMAGEGIIPFAFSSDGIIEAVYRADYGFLIGVQWHPERMVGELSHAIFRGFVGACRDY
jgi:putative glutamine amidotransferase